MVAAKELSIAVTTQQATNALARLLPTTVSAEPFLQGAAHQLLAAEGPARSADAPVRQPEAPPEAALLLPVRSPGQPTLRSTCPSADLQVISSHVTSCYIMSHHVTSCYIMLHHVTSCHVMSCQAKQSRLCTANHSNCLIVCARPVCLLQLWTNTQLEVLHPVRCTAALHHAISCSNRQLPPTSCETLEAAVGRCAVGAIIDSLPAAAPSSSQPVTAAAVQDPAGPP